MKYNILVIADIHWGVIGAEEEWRQLEFFFTALSHMEEKQILPHLIVIAGDYFDSKLSLNSQEAISAIDWFNRLYDYCNAHQIQLRIFQGTMSHDNDQLEALRTFEESETNKCFKLFMEPTIEETLPNLTCCYCPDVLEVTEEFEINHMEFINQEKDIGFFHGSFDRIFDETMLERAGLFAKKNIIFRYSLWNKTIAGPMISGHWHNATTIGDLYYVGSPFRWQFAEDLPKGALFVQYNTDDQTYFVKRIINPICPIYQTVTYFTNTIHSDSDYTAILRKIDEIMMEFKNSDVRSYLRVMLVVNDDKDLNEKFLMILRKRINGYKRCRLSIKDLMKKGTRKDKEKETDYHDYDFIFDKKIKTEQIIHDYILKVSKDKGKELSIPLEFIADKVKKYK